MPKVSVLMPVYNAAKYLGEAIDSIISQTYTDWEIVVIDDGSTDGSAAIIQSYSDSRIQYFRNESNMGLIDTLNKGVGLCRGDYIARMDADDISMPQRFAAQVDFLDRNPDYAMCGANAMLIDEGGREVGKILNLQNNEYLQVNLLFSVPFVHPLVMIRKDVLKDNLFDKEYKHAEDYDLWCRIAENHKVANLSSILLKYRWHSTNVSVVNREEQNKVKDKIICRQLSDIGLVPTQEELWLHQISFRQYDVKEKLISKLFSDYDKLNDWFNKIIKANESCHKYNAEVLTAYLWSRWIVVCISQKNFLGIFKPRFVSLSFNILKKTLELLVFFSKK